MDNSVATKSKYQILSSFLSPPPNFFDTILLQQIYERLLHWGICVFFGKILSSFLSPLPTFSALFYCNKFMSASFIGVFAFSSEIVSGSCLKNISTLVSILQLSGSANVHFSRVWDCLFLTYYWDCFCKKLHQKCLFDKVLNTLLIGHHQILCFSSFL